MTLFRRNNNSSINPYSDEANALLKKKDGNATQQISLRRLSLIPTKQLLIILSAFLALYTAGSTYKTLKPDRANHYLNIFDKILTRVLNRQQLMNIGLVTRTQNFEHDFDVNKVLSDFMERREKVAKDPKSESQDCLEIGTSNFNKKIDWRMRHDRRPILGLMADKVTSKLFAEAINVTYPKDIYEGDCDSIPNVDGENGIKDYAFKSSHTCGCNMVVRNGTVIGHKKCLFREKDLRGTEVSNALLKKICKSWMSNIYSVREWAYQTLKPTVMMEELVPEAIDLKCYTFNGKTEFLRVLHTDQSSWKRTEEFYDAHTFEYRTKPYDNYNAGDSLPSAYLSKSIIEEAVKLCNYIGLGLDFARVDLMLMGEEAYKNEDEAKEGDKNNNYYFQLGEMTMYPKSGAHPFRPKQASIVGDLWCLPKHHSIND